MLLLPVGPRKLDIAHFLSHKTNSDSALRPTVLFALEGELLREFCRPDRDRMSCREGDFKCSSESHGPFLSVHVWIHALWKVTEAPKQGSLGRMERKCERIMVLFRSGPFSLYAAALVGFCNVVVESSRDRKTGRFSAKRAILFRRQQSYVKCEGNRNPLWKLMH